MSTIQTKIVKNVKNKEGISQQQQKNSASNNKRKKTWPVDLLFNILFIHCNINIVGNTFHIMFLGNIYN